MIAFSHDRRRNGIPLVVATVVRMHEDEDQHREKLSREKRLENLKRAAAERRPLFGR